MNENEMMFDQQDIETNKVMSAVSYLGVGLLFFLPLVAAKDSAFGRFHANQALVLLLLSIVSVVINIIPILGQIIYVVIGIACFVFMILGIINGAKGQAKELPIIGKIRIIK